MNGTAPRTVVVIGTSPPVLMRALSLAEAGHQVRILDRAAAIGGSWTTAAEVGLEAVECGVHLLENRSDFYAALEAVGIPLERDDQCFTLLQGRRLDMGRARVLFHALVAANALRRRQPDRFRRIARSAARSAVDTRVAFRYPAAGCRAINEGLLAQLAAAGITPELETEITGIAIDSATGVRCATSAGPVDAAHVVISSRAHAPITIDGAEHSTPKERNRVASLLLRGTDPTRPDLSYVELMRHPLFQRVRDVTPFCVPAVGGHEFVLCAQLRPAGEETLLTAGADALLSKLAEQDLLSPRARLTASALCEYAYETITDAALRTLERAAGGRLITVPTTDFADGFIGAAPSRRRRLASA